MQSFDLVHITLGTQHTRKAPTFVWHLISPNWCVLCNSTSETTLDHLILRFKYTYVIWPTSRMLLTSILSFLVALTVSSKKSYLVSSQANIISYGVIWLVPLLRHVWWEETIAFLLASLWLSHLCERISKLPLLHEHQNLLFCNYNIATIYLNWKLLYKHSSLVCYSFWKKKSSYLCHEWVGVKNFGKEKNNTGLVDGLDLTNKKIRDKQIMR